MPPKGFTCKKCGHCCRELEDAYGTNAGEDDIIRWEQNGRWDIMEWVESYDDGRGVLVNDIWVNPKTREDAAKCPWLRKRRNKDEYYCRINDLKPRHCREYPVSRKHAADTGCPGFE